MLLKFEIVLKFIFFLSKHVLPALLQCTLRVILQEVAVEGGGWLQRLGAVGWGWMVDVWGWLKCEKIFGRVGGLEVGWW